MSDVPRIQIGRKTKMSELKTRAGSWGGGKAIRNPQSLAYLACVQAGPETLPGSIQGARGRRNNNTQEARMAWGEK
ncbi:predicted protein [Histoplasma mississippiense (nom. inval.)]|uniref:predicted protein n=1 Tax=Ajellomyces capsulatus (strain NAm1 / WU24) TaxID=2059318 RepID=UPI000157CC42|nr:predicted protein [Histoplasma mississippiense (nom. inval.)]EDN09879.1 predicted protein [Histoplasma mississippiense (nom. inval.)]